MNLFRFFKWLLVILIIGISFSANEDDNIFYTDSWALLIGIDKYHNWPQLNYAVSDAERMQKLLTEKLGFPNDNVYMLLDEEATLLNIKKEMNKLKNLSNANDRVLVYFAGHGITVPLPKRGEEGYLLPVDSGEEDALDITAYPMSEMRRFSDRVPAKDMLFLMDACYSGLMGIRGLKLDSNDNMALKIRAAGNTRTIITAGQKGQVAQERPQWGTSAMVKSLLYGLGTGAADYNKDGYITDWELGNHLMDQVTIDTDGNQTPDMSHYTSEKGMFVFIIGDINQKIEVSKNNKSVDLDYDKLAEKIAEKMSEKKDGNESDTMNIKQNIIQLPEDSLYTVKDYYSSGIIKYQHNYNIKGEKHGLQQGYYSSGIKKYKYKYHNGLMNGDQIGYRSSSITKYLFRYNNGEQDGFQIEYNSNGIKKSETLYKSDKFVSGPEIDFEMFEMYDDGNDSEIQEEILVGKEDVEEAVVDVLDALKDLGININSEEIAKNITDNIPFDNFPFVVEDENEEKQLVENTTFSKSPTYHFDEFSWVRYNRSEGLYFQLNGTFQSEYIPGSSFYGGIGRAFHRNEYQFILGYEQLMFKNTLQFYFEVFDKSITPDAWRVWDGENSLSAVFLKKDYLDWYRGNGLRAAGFMHVKNYISFGIEYNEIDQHSMNNILDSEKFNDHKAYKIIPGNNYHLKYIVTMGYPIDIEVRNKLQLYLSFIRSQSVGHTYHTFMKDHFVFNLLAPYTSDLNFNIKMLAGASNVADSIWNEQGYHQHIFEIGGKGTLRGYNWKQFYSSHYFLSTIEIWFDEFGILYDRAVMFESPGNQFGLDYFDDLSKNFTSNVHHSAGFSIGDEDLSLSFIRTLDDDPTTIIYLTLGTPIQYW